MPETAKTRAHVIHWVYAVGFWTLVALLYATRADMHGLPLTPVEAAKASIARWYVWAALSFFIVAVDRRLPIRQEALTYRFIAHVPISLFFIGLYTYLNY